MQDADVMVPSNYYIVMGNLGHAGLKVPERGGPADGYPAFGLAKTCKVYNAETGSYRFVNERMEGVYEVDNRHPTTPYASEVMWLHRSVIERLPRPFYRPENLNEDYELCRVLKGLGVAIYIAPVEAIAS